MRGQLAITPVSGEGKEITGGLFFWGFVMLLRTEAMRGTQGCRLQLRFVSLGACLIQAT